VPGHAAAAERGQPGIAGTVRATTTTGRRGAYYLPPRRDSEALPLLVILHGTGGMGSGMLVRLRAIAEREKFIVVAPDSVSIAGGWLVERGSRGVTEDRRHVLDCLGEVLAMPGVRVDRAQVLIAGFSVGGGAASYIASHEEVFTAFASLHGHVVLDGIGPRRVRAWLSTGDRDSQRTVEYLRSVADRLIRREGFPEVEMRVFRGGHTLAEEELVALVAWWLRRPDHGGALAPGRR
jgi:poly(3-hydroxybutyrate) depolymerase